MYTVLVAVFLTINLVVFGGIIAYNHQRNAERTLNHTAEALASTASQLRTEVEAAFRPALELVRAAPDLAWSREGEPFPPAARHRAAMSMAVNTHISSVYFAAGETDFIQVYRVPPGETLTWGALSSPSDAGFAVRHLHGPADGQRAESWSFLDPTGAPLETTAERTNRFYPRTRPWHKAALATAEVVVSPPYAFATLDTVGVTVSRAVVGGVFAVDMTLVSLSRVLDGLEIPEGGRALVFDRAGQVVAHPERTGLLVRDGGEMRALRTSELDDPVIAALYDTALGGGHLEMRKRAGFVAANGLFAFSMNGDDYVAQALPLDSSIADDIFLGVALPRAAILGDVTRHTGTSIAASGLALLLGTVVSLLLARALARPISLIAEEARHIRKMELNHPLHTRSALSELHELTVAMSSMKTALQALGRYIPSAVIQVLVRDEKLPELGGESREVTVMFTDVADFTELAELMSPKDLMRKLSSYYSVLSEAILAESGTIDKYIGDSIMAVWNGVEEQPDHAWSACRAALAAAAANDKLNASWRSWGWPEMHTRFGLHLGEAVVGNIGSEARMDHTVVGATINTASRLEGLNKAYGTRILVSEPVRDRVGERALFRSVDWTRPKGTTVPIKVYELVGATQDLGLLTATPEDRRRCARWEEIYAQYMSRNWAQVAERLKGFMQDYPQDGVAAAYRQRVLHFMAEPPGKDWDGVADHKEK